MRVFMEWTFSLAERDANSDAMSERSTCILQEITVQLTKTENDTLTIRYPQRPRVRDVVNLKREGKEVKGKASSRALVDKGGGKVMKVKCSLQSGGGFESELELSCGSGVSGAGDGIRTHDALVGKSGFRLVLPPTDWVVAAEEVAAEGLGDDLAAPVEAAV